MTDYEKYEALVLEKDALEKEAGQILTLYIKVFGDLINEVFAKKISCIQKKKTIAFCQAAVNRQERINSDELNRYLEEEMSGHKAELQKMIKETRECKDSKLSSDYELQKAKSIYRRLAKKIHPDINPVLYADAEDHTFELIWNDVMLAYHKNDAQKLIELEVIINRELKERGIETEDIEIEDIETKIENLETEIERIRSTDPYLFRLLLDDEEACAEKKRSLQEELTQYTEYEAELNKVLQTYLINGVEITWKPD